MLLLPRLHVGNVARGGGGGAEFPNVGKVKVYTIRCINFPKSRGRGGGKSSPKGSEDLLNEALTAYSTAVDLTSTALCVTYSNFVNVILHIL